MKNSFFRNRAVDRLQRLFLSAFLFFCPALVFAQRQGQNTDQNAPNTKPIHDHMSSKDVAEKLHKALDSKNPAYAGSKIDASADDQTVTLSGTVTSSMQHEMAMQLARAYAGNRKIVDKLTIQ